jgi:thioredoxin reductase
MTETDHPDRDVLVLGGGAAGLSAALLLARARLRVTVIDGGQPRNAPAEHMHGFLTQDGLPPAKLVEAGRAEVIRYGGEFVDERVETVAPGFRVRTADGSELTASRLLVTTGMRDELPKVSGVAERWGRDVLQCPYCHGYEVRDQPLGVLATSPGSVHQAHLVRGWSDDVVLFEHTYRLADTEREELTARGIRLVPGEVADLVIDGDAVRGVRLTDGTTENRTAVFVTPKFVPNAGMLEALGCDTDERGFITVDANGATSTPGVWAAGNVVNSRAQVIIAAGAGTAAAMAIHGDITRERIRLAVGQV